jgi:hypothetical protein
LEIIRFNPSIAYLIDPYVPAPYEELLPSDTTEKDPLLILKEAFSEYYPGGIDSAIPNAQKYVQEVLGSNPLVKFVAKSSKEAVDDFEDGSIDFLHLDANNRFDFVLANLMRWEKKVSLNGVIVANNCYVSQIGERQFISALEGVSRFIKSSERVPIGICNRWFSNVLLCRKSSVGMNSSNLLNVLLTNKINFLELPSELIHSVRHKRLHFTLPDGGLNSLEFMSFMD